MATRTKPTYTTSQIITQLTTSWGGGYVGTLSWASKTPITFSINTTTAPTNFGSTTSEAAGLTAMKGGQVDIAKLSFQLWADLINRPLSESANNPNAQITLNYSSTTQGAGTYTAFSYSGSSFNANQIWLNTTWPTNMSAGTSTIPKPGNYGLITMIHEIGHALGLSHPGLYNAGSGGTITYSNSAVFSQDNRQYTVMSYFGGYLPGSGWQQDGTSVSYIFPQTPMVYDIAAIQFLYGANPSAHTENTTYGFNASDFGNLENDIYNFINNPTPIFSIWDSSGIDTLDCSIYSGNQKIDLTPGNYSSVDGFTNNIGIAFGCNIECAVGGSGNDTLIAGAALDTLQGGLGNDTYIVNNTGDIILESLSNGTDLVQTSVTYSLSTNVENMTLTGSAAINGTGNDLANIILGNTGNNILIGGLGNDTLYGGAGNDTLTGEAGNDVFVFDTLPNQTTNSDLITDFVSRGSGTTANSAADYLLFSKSVFNGVSEKPASGSQVTIASAELRSGANIVTAQTTSQHFIYNTTTGILYYDQDGSTNKYSPIQIALLGAANTTHPGLDYRDIHILG